MRPYEHKLMLADEAGQVLKREHIYGSGPPVDRLSDQVAGLVQQHCTGSVVDFGAGCGALQSYLAPGATYLGIEANPVGVAMALERSRNVRLGDVLDSGLSDASFDVCAMIEVLEHIDDYERAVSEAHRVCRSHLFLTVPNIGVIPEMGELQIVPWHMLESTHVNFFTAETLRKTLAKVFARVTVWPIHEWFRPGLHMNLAALAYRN